MRGFTKLLLITYSIIFGLCLSAQDAPERFLEVGGMVEHGVNPLANAVINIYQNGTLDRTVRSGMDGEFKFRLDVNSYYRIEISKNNMVTKSIEFDTQVPDDMSEKWITSFAMSMFEGCDGVNTSFFDQPVDVIKYSKRGKGFESDKTYVQNRMFDNQEKMIEIQECQLNKHKDLIREADKLFREGNYEEARELYEKALEMFPSDRLPQRKLEEIARKLNNEVEQKQKYEQLIAEADQLMAAGDITGARAKYNEALRAQPQNNYPREKIATIDKQIAAKAANDRAAQASTLQYQNLMDRATAAYAAKNFAEAKALYQQALALRPGESLPTQKIAELEPLIVQQQQALQRKAAGDKLYQEAIAMADKALLEKKYDIAQEHYQRALTLSPSNPYPRQKIQQISDMVQADRNAKEQAIRAEKESEFNRLINQGDVLLDQKNFEGALAAYQQALQIKPSDRYAQNKLNSVKNMLTAAATEKQAALERNFGQAMSQGDSYKLSKQYALAVQSYQKALELKPGTPGVQAKIDESKNLLDQEQRLLANEKQKQAKYNEVIGQADRFYASNQIDQAKAMYQQASSILPSENYPKNKLAEINNRMAAAQKDKSYADAVAEGDKLLAQKDFSNARMAYQRALSAKPTETYPQQKINEISQLVNQNRRQEALNREQYQQLIQSADNYLRQSVLELAKADYEKARQLFPNEQYPVSQISKISLMLADQQKREGDKKAQYQQTISQADQLFNQNQYEQARSTYLRAASLQPSERYPKQQLATIDIKLNEQKQQLAQKQSQYQQSIKTADTYLSQRNYVSAKAEYEKAKSLLPNEQYPSTQITKINGLLNEQAKQAGAKKEQYNQLIGMADQQFGQKQYQQALSNYNQAASLFPSESYPRQKINEVNRLLAEQNSLKADQQRTQNQYNSLISEADNYYNSDKIPLARSSYLRAQALLPNEAYPKAQIAKIDAVLAEQQAMAKNKAELDRKYGETIRQADQLFGSGNFQQAKTYYQQALSFKPNEIYPRNKIAEADRQLGQQNKKSQYDAAIAEANRSFTQKDYANAKAGYNKALSILPDETYPRTRLNEINQLEAESNRRQAENQRILQQYQQSVQLADKYFSEENYDLSKAEYQKAKSIKSDESYPNEQIAKIDRLIAQNQKAAADQALRDRNYNSYISQADDAFRAKSYVQAKGFYTSALSLKPNEVHPKQQLTIIDELLDRQAAAKQQQAAIDLKYNNAITKADEAFAVNNLKPARAYYLEALKVKAGEPYPKAQIRKIDERERIIAQNAAKQRSTQVASTTKPPSNSALSENNFKSESERRKYLLELKSKYPDGMTLETYKEKTKTTKRYIIIRNDEVNEFRHVQYSWGAEFTLNGKPVTSQYFKQQTQQKSGEAFQEFSY